MNFMPPKNLATNISELPPPEPAAGMKAYRWERAKALACSRRRLWNYVKYRVGGRRDQLNYLPIKLDVENVSRCNFHCIMCQVSDWPYGKRADDMSLRNFKALIDEQSGVVEIKLQGMGEPTLQGAPFFEMIRYARVKNIWVRTLTNASLLHLDDNYQRLIDSGVNEVQISIDGADRETFTKIRRGADFDRVLENCRRINAYCASLKLQRTKMWTVVQRDNQHQLDALVELAANLGFAHQVFALSLVDWGDANWQGCNRDISIDRSFRHDSAARLLALGDRWGVTVRFWHAEHKYNTSDSARGCPWPFERSFVTSDGRVAPCCLVANPDNYELNGARDLSGIWHGAAYQEFRLQHLDGQVPDICRHCYTVKK